MTGMNTDPADTSAVLVQPGWHLYSKDGEALGEVVAADPTRIILRPEGADDERIEIRTDTLIEQEEAEMRARISLDASEVRSQG
jgi:hypothetical protein